MSPDRAVLERAIERGEREGGSVEFKERLTKDLHLADGRRESLAAQLRHRVLSGDGEATYVVGITDDGAIAGIPADAFTESMDVLSLLAEEADAHIENVETWGVDADGNAKPKGNGARPRGSNGAQAADEGDGTQAADEGDGTQAANESDAPAKGIVGVATVREGAVLEDDEHIVVGTAGHVDHGKSTLVGSLVTGQPDDGEGGTRSYLDVQPHEVERGLSADLSYGVYGFDDEGPVRMDNPDRKTDRARVVEEADRLVSFVDTVGHEPWLRTTIRGLVGQKLDYGLLTVAADDGPTKTTREHLGILLATDLPTLVVVTKADLVSDDRLDEVEREVERLLREVGKTPLSVARHGVGAAVEEIDDTVVPVLATSAVTMDGMDALDELLERLPKTAGPEEGEFAMYVDRSYNVTGVGAVASGTIRSGRVEAGDELLLGPMTDGSFREVEFLPNKLEELFGRNMHFVSLAAYQDFLDNNTETARAVRSALLDAAQIIHDDAAGQISQHQDFTGFENDEQVQMAADRAPAMYPVEWNDESRNNITDQIEQSKDLGTVPEDAPTDIIGDI